MSAYQSKYHIGLNSEGYILSQNSKGERYYQKKRAPSFVNKFGSGDSSYRDATFWQYFVQTNWRNGAKQLKYDDPGKFWKSENVDTTILEELSLSKAFESAGQLASGIKVNCMEAWRSSTSWYNASYGYRQQITVTAPASQQVPSGYPVKVTIDTAALQTASKVRSDRNDWRIVYWNGSTWVDLYRDYVSTTATFFATQTVIAAGGSDSNYYVYYGYSAESTSKQPSAEADWNAVYGMYGTTPDANSIAVYHFKEGSGSSINDDSSSTYNGTVSGSPSWATDGKFGRYLTFNGNGQGVLIGNADQLDLGSFTIEAWVKYTAANPNLNVIGKNFAYTISTHDWIPRLNVSTISLSAGAAYNDGTWHHIAGTYDGATTAKIYIDGDLKATSTAGGAVTDSSSYAWIANNSSTGTADSGQNWQGSIQHVRISNTARTSFPYVLSSEPSTSYGSETTTQPPSTSFDLYSGGSDGKIYKWDGTTTWTEQFDCRRIVWYETGADANKVVGDTGGTETAQAQGFQIAAGQTISGAQVYIKKAAGTPGDITVRIETDSTGTPSGTLVNSNATGTITAFTTDSYSWKEVTFAGTFTLSASTTYHLVLKTAAAANDQNYTWAADGSSPSFTSGAMSASTDGGSTWSAVSAADAYFRLLGNATEANCMKVTSVGGTQKLYIGTGSPTGQTNGDARLYSYDGSVWALTKTFTTSTEAMINSIEEYSSDSKVYIGVGPQARIYYTSDFSTFTLGKDINAPQNPGYVYAMKEYNRVLHVGGGSPEFLPSQYYNGFLNVYDTTAWNVLYPFDFTVIKSLEFYDAYLFMGSYHGHLYVYDTASLNPLFNFKDQYAFKVEIKAMKYFDDKLYIGLYPQESFTESNVGIWVFDRRGMSLAHSITGVTGYRCFTVVNGSLFVGTGDDGYIYKLNNSSYATQGWAQSSYFDANLPSIDKLYNSITIRHDPLTAGQSIVVYYKYKESDAWTTLGTSNTVDATEKTINFASGSYSKKISLKYELNTSNTSTTPKLTEVILQYTLYPERKWQWTLRVKAKKNLRLLDKSLETRTAEEIRSDLEALVNTRQLYTYVDIDGASYNVLVNDIDNTSWVVNQSDVNEDEVIVTLLEA